MNITGFIVVRRPNLNYLVPGRDLIPQVNGIYYSGVDRQRWADVFDEDFYSKKAPKNARMLAQGIRNNAHDFTGIDLCPDAEVALKLLQYSNREREASELIAVRCSELDAIKGTVETELAVSWMGYDLVAVGEWSLIEAGLFRYPGYYVDWLPRINRFGLFDDPLLLGQYATTYETAVAEGRSEPLAPKSTGLGWWLAIEVGHVQ